MTENIITMTLMLFGIAGIIGSMLFSKFYPKFKARFINVTLCGLIMGVFLLLPSSSYIPFAIACCALIGLASTAFNVAMQAEIISKSPASQSSVAMSIFSGIFNFGIGTGALIGGVVCSHLSIHYIGFIGGAIVMIALAIYLNNKG